MKRIRLVMIALAMMTLAAGVASASTTAPRIDRREWRQHERIQQGWRSRELSRREHARLHAGQRHIHRMEWRAGRDGHIDRFERRRLTRTQNEESRRIYRLKHNGETRII